MKQKYNVTGMSCSACSAHVEKAVSKVPGVNSVQVNLLQNSMVVDYDEAATNDQAIIHAVEEGGYGASVKGEEKAEDVTAKSVDSVRIFFQANKELKITKTATRAGERLDLVCLDDYLKGLSNIPAEGGSDSGSGDNSGDGGLDENPLG